MHLLFWFFLTLAVLCYQIGRMVGDKAGYRRGYKEGREALR
jgi:hypothetical protein